MNPIQKLAFAGAFAVSAAAAGGASATSLIVTDVNVDSYNTLFVPGHGNEITTAIILNGNVVVFCDDLEHNVNIGGGQHLPYHTGAVMFDGAGNPLSKSLSNRLGQLADIGVGIAGSSDPDKHDDLTAVQAAIWSLEYGVNIVSGDSEINSEILAFKGIADNGAGYAIGLISDNGHQSFLTGGSVPEPATWALMIGGFGLAGVMLRRRSAVAV
jgi:hypothetical protein